MTRPAMSVRRDAVQTAGVADEPYGPLRRLPLNVRESKRQSTLIAAPAALNDSPRCMAIVIFGACSDTGHFR